MHANSSSLDIYTLDLKGVWNSNPPQVLRMHLAAYEARTDIKAVLHAHSTSLESFATCGSVPNTLCMNPIFHLCGIPAFIDYVMTNDTQDALIRATFCSTGSNCALISGKGILCVGRDLEEAFQVFEAMDFCARMILKALQIGPPKALSSAQCSSLDYVSSRTCFGTENIPYRCVSSFEKSIRASMIQVLNKGLSQGLISCSSGTISFKLDNNSLLMTPTGIDRNDLNVHDLLLIRLDDAFNIHLVHGFQDRPDTLPSRALKAHISIYKRHANINAILSAHPLHVAAFCCLNYGIDSRFLPAPYSFVSRVPIYPFELLLDPERVAKEFTENETGEIESILIANEGCITVGRGLEDALGKLQALESVCAIAMDARSLGSELSVFLSMETMK
jgi:L-fuculose-phosphate aldolase